MSYKFAEYELVTVNSLTNSPIGAIRGWNSIGSVYDVRLLDGNTLQIAEDNLTTTRQFEVPFRFFEVVEIHPLRFEDEPSFVKIIGKRGVITGVSSSTQSGCWGFSLETQDGVCWYLEENELKSIGVILSEEQLYGPSENRITVRLHYNPVTEAETVIEGNASLFNQGPTPLQIDLNTL